MECILCNNNNIRFLSTIYTSDVCRIYLSWFSLDITRMFEELESFNYVECQSCGLRFFTPLIAGTSWFYKALSQKMGVNYYIEDKSEYRFAGTFITESDSVLDVGSGCGCFRKFVKGQYLGLDFNESAILHAEEVGATVVNESIEEHVQKNAHSYNVVAAFQVLEHMPRPDLFIKTCLKALKPNGLLILSVPSEDSYVSMQENLILNMPPHHVTRWSDNTLINISKLFGLRHVSLEHERLSSIHYNDYLKTIAFITLRKLLNLETNKLIDLSLNKRVISRLVKYIMPLYAKIFLLPEILPNGHSVTSVYKLETTDRNHGKIGKKAP